MNQNVKVVLDDVRGARVEYVESFLDDGERATLRAELEAARPLFRHDPLPTPRGPVPSPRLVCRFGDPGLRYRYSGTDEAAHPWPACLHAIAARITTLIGQRLSYALVNLYRDGRDYVGWHSDAERDIARDSCIASISLGAPRVFQLRAREPGSPIEEVVLGDGSLLLMRGATQRLYKHQLPKRPRVREARLNVTLRLVLPRSGGRDR